MPQDVANAVRGSIGIRSNRMARYPLHFALAALGFGPSPKRA